MNESSFDKYFWAIVGLIVIGFFFIIFWSGFDNDIVKKICLNNGMESEKIYRHSDGDVIRCSYLGQDGFVRFKDFKIPGLFDAQLNCDGNITRCGLIGK